MKRAALAAALSAAGLAAGDARAVILSPDGLGQALIYPYFTVQSSEGDNSWNTYISVVNHTADAKVLRVRFREGRAGRNIGNLNLYLAPNDVWTGAIVPSDASASSVARIITPDASCTDPNLPAAGETFTNALYSGSFSDGLGSGLDRTREGYIEMIEMATLTGASAVAVTHVDGVPDDCSVVLFTGANGSGYNIAPDVRPPSGGLSGTLTLLNVNSGMDMGMNALALDQLSRTGYFRVPGNDYPGFGAAEVLPESTVRANGREYDLKWRNGVDAVSSVFMASELLNEYVLDRGTASQTDWVITFPTRPYLSPTTPPFKTGVSVDSRDIYDREGNVQHDSLAGLCLPLSACPGAVLDHAASAAFSVGNAFPESLLGSREGTNLGFGLRGDFASGWMRIRAADGLSDFGRLRSEPGSTMTELATGIVTAGRFELFGLPWTGFMVRTFRNGTLVCATGSCQGNYAGSFPHRYVRTITSIP